MDEQKISHDEAYDVMKSVEVERKVVDLLVEQVLPLNPQPTLNPQP